MTSDYNPENTPGKAPRKRARSERKMDYDNIPEEYAILTTDSNKTLKQIAIIISLGIVIVASYYLIQTFVSPKPKVFLQMYDKIDLDYRATTVKAVNEAAKKENHIALQVKVIAKPNPYKNVYGEQAFRDYALVSFINPNNHEIGKVFIKLQKTSGGYYEGISRYTFSKAADRDNTLSSDVMIMLTNKQRAADMIPVRVPIIEK